MRGHLAAAALACAVACAPSRADAPKPAPPPRPAPAPAQKPAPTPTPTPPSEPAPSQRFERDMMTRLHMHESFDLLRAIERLLIRGRLEEAKAFAAAISEAPDEPGLGPWTGQAIAVRARAAALARAATLEVACAHEAQLAAACASCHVDAGVTPQFRDHPPAPPDHPTIEARMARHRWAADRMWEGLVGGADEPWRAGLEIAAAAPLDWKDLGPDRVAFARKLQQIAQQARRPRPKETLSDRATAYGEILTTCAGCHMAPPPPPPPRR